MFIGDGAKLVRDAFELAKEKAPAIIFIDELDAIGTKRFDSEKSGDREVQRTMLELLNQLDGFSSVEQIKVIAATNRIDILDPALLRSGRLDRKIEFPLPDEKARAKILEIHSRKMSVEPDVNYAELARSTDEFNGAQLKATCVEAGMIALREGASKLNHEHFLSGIAEGELSRLKLYNPILMIDYSPVQEEERPDVLCMISIYVVPFSILSDCIIHPTYTTFRIYIMSIKYARALDLGEQHTPWNMHPNDINTPYCSKHKLTMYRRRTNTRRNCSSQS
jgi:SpoVK/Ycf46/Vps4 family AAA+-type ATPase